MNDLPEKLRHFAAMRKKLGFYPVGYEYFEQAANNLESMERQIKKLEQRNSELNKHCANMTNQVSELMQETARQAMLVNKLQATKIDAALEFDSQQRWISVDERLPEYGVPVLVFVPEIDAEKSYITTDLMDKDYEYWLLVSDNYNHAQAVGRVTDNDIIPTGIAPYTHWQPLPQPPKENTNERD
jgi:hypothetical protein